MVTSVAKKAYRTLLVPDPVHLVGRLKQGVKAGALSRVPRAKLVGQDFLLVNEGNSPKAWALVRMGQGAAFRDGAAAVEELGAKVDGLAAKQFAGVKGQVWFHPLALLDAFDSPRAVGAKVEKESAPAEQPADLQSLATPALLSLFGVLDREFELGEVEVAKSDEVVSTAGVLLEELDRREAELPAGALVEAVRDQVEKGLFGYPAGKSASAKRIVAMIPPHKTYVEPFVGSGAVLFAKERCAVEVVNDMRQDVADAWRALSKLTPADIKLLQQKSWTGSRSRWKSLMASKPSGLIEKLYRFLYTMRFGFAGASWKGFATTREGHTLSMPTKLENVAPRAKGVVVYSGDYETVCRKYDSPSTFFFFDPPYVGTDNTVGEGKFDEGRFFKMLTQLKGRWILTYGVHGELPKMLKTSRFNVSTFETNRSARSQPGAGGSSALKQIMATNYSPSGVSKAIASIEKRDTKGALQKPHVCKYDDCDGQATFAIVWGKGEACVPACDKHRAYYQQKQPDVVAVRALPQPAEKAVWSTAYVNNLEDDAFLYIAPGGEKDDEGKTVPRTLRYFPVRDENGEIDAPHIRNAIARIPQSTAPGLTAEKMKSLQDKARKLLSEITKADDEQETLDGPWTRAPVIKSEALRYVFGLVLEPNDGEDGNPLDPDTQNHTYSAAEIWQAWFDYTVSSEKLGLLHKQIIGTKEMVLLDNYIMQDDATIGGQKFRKGSWVMGAFVKSDELWQRVVDGTYGGWSIQGSAILELMRAA
jgi:site-specific DNA-adenine methylase